MRLFVLIVLLPSLGIADSFSSGITVSGDGLVIGNAPIRVQRNSNGDLKANFSVMKMLSGAGTTEGELPVLQRVVIPPKTDMLSDSDTFFNGVGENRKNEPERMRLRD